jgi:hypothetical protein
LKKILSTVMATRGLGLAVILLSGIALAQQPADVHGWGKVKWGMTLEQIQKLYPEAKPYQPKDEAERKAMQFSDESALVIPTIDLVNTKFEVNFVGKGTNKQIVFVEIYSRAGVTEGAFTELEKQLKREHGEPALKNDKDGWFERTWMLPSTKIELWFHEALQREPPAVGISYSPADKRAKGQS